MMNADPIQTIICQIDSRDRPLRRPDGTLATCLALGCDQIAAIGYGGYCEAHGIQNRYAARYEPPIQRDNIDRCDPTWLGVGVGVLGLLAAVAVVYALVVVFGAAHGLELPPALGGGR
jgi:hypothetical protein